MAKGNMFLGQARGKVGDLVFYRQDGEQLSRSRNRHPRNPRTEPQLYQRAIMSTVTNAYKAGKQLFDHSFQGFSVGAANQRQFLGRNIKLLRGLVSADLSSALEPSEMVGRVVGPGTASPVGFAGLIVSAGDYPMAAFTFTPQDVEGQDSANWKLPAIVSGETRAQYAARVGLIAGDYFTFVMFHYDDIDDPVIFRVQGAADTFAGEQFRQHFAFLRLGVKASFVQSTDPADGSTLGDVFEFDTYSADINTTALQARSAFLRLDLDELVIVGGSQRLGYIALIRSRLDSDLRSDSAMVWGAAAGYSGITSAYALDAWSQGTQAVGNSQLILEGGGF